MSMRLKGLRVAMLMASPLTLVVVLAACAGGSTSSSAPAAVPTPSGLGYTGPYKGAPAPPQSLVQQAQKEGRLVIYSATSNPTAVDALDKAFEQAYPGISVTATFEDTTSMVAKVEAQAAAGSPQVDVLDEIYSGFFTQGVSKGILLADAQIIPNFNQLFPSQYVLGNGAAGVSAIFENGLSYNTNMVQKSDLPKTYADLADPKWKGKLICYDPNTALAGAFFWGMMLQKYGTTVTKEVAQNCAANQWYSSFEPGEAALGAGAAPINTLAASSEVATVQKAGGPVAFYTPNVATGAENVIGVVNHSPDPAAAKLFTYWAFSMAGQKAQAIALGASEPLYPLGLTPGFVPPDYSVPANLAPIDAVVGRST
jgi:iron(III) transport system substrate-binding protein